MHYYGETQGTCNTEIDWWLLTCTNQNQNQLFNDGCEQKLFFDHTPSACSSVKRRPHKKEKHPIGKIKYGSGWEMLWNGFVAGGSSALVKMEGDGLNKPWILLIKKIFQRQHGCFCKEVARDRAFKQMMSQTHFQINIEVAKETQSQCLAMIMPMSGFELYWKSTCTNLDI